MSTTANGRTERRMGVRATIVDIVDAGGFWLFQADFGHGIAETSVERRYMADIVAGEGLSSPGELIGRRIWVSKDGNQIAFIDDE